MASNVLSDKDVNAAVAEQPSQSQELQKSGKQPENENAGKGVKSMDYHRQVFQSKMAEEERSGQYVFPSDSIMSPCTAKLNALRNKHAAKAKPKSLFAQASAKKMVSDRPLSESPSLP